MVENDDNELADVDASRYEVTDDSGVIVTKQYSGLIGGGEEEDYDARHRHRHRGRAWRSSYLPDGQQS